MYSLTLTIAIVASVLVLALRPAYAFVVYLAALLWYPSYLVVNVGTLDISAVRIVVSVLFLRCLYSGKIRRLFVWSRLDTVVTFSIVVYIAMFLITRPFSVALENRSGFLLDTWFAYMAVRFCITTREGFITVVKCVGILLAPLAILGAIEAVAGWQPYLPFTQYCPWRQGVMTTEPRTGFNRAVGPFGHPIMFGACFAMFLPLIYSLRHQKNWRNLAYILSAMTIIGALSSMSGGPCSMVMAAVLFLAMEKLKHWGKSLLVLFVIACIGTGIISNRPFYYPMAQYMNPIGGSWWHRCKLIDCAIRSFNEWFLLGYKGQDPGWGSSVGMAFTDVTNQFLLNAVQYGILGVIVLCLVLGVAIKEVALLHNSSSDPVVKSWAWALGSMIATVIVAFMSVSFFGQTSTLFYCVLGMIGSVAHLSRREVYMRSQIQGYQRNERAEQK